MFPKYFSVFFRQPPEQAFNERLPEPRLAASNGALVILRKAAVAIHPPKTAFDDPAFGHHDEAFRAIAPVNHVDAEARFRRCLVDDLTDVRIVDENRCESRRFRFTRRTRSANRHV
jgi:hypothetical protein